LNKKYKISFTQFFEKLIILIQNVHLLKICVFKKKKNLLQILSTFEEHFCNVRTKI